MSITEELRVIASTMNAGVYEKFCEIADLVDQEVAENYIELPKDKDGKPIHVGDTVLVHLETRKVIAIDGKSKVLCYFGNIIDFCLSEDCLLVELDTQEKIDADAECISSEPCAYWNKQPFDCTKCARDANTCGYEAIQDLLRRQRALDGVK